MPYKQPDLFSGPDPEKDLHKLQELNTTLNRLITRIEGDLRRREYTENTLAMLEDALAIVVDLLIHERQQAEWREGRIRKLLSVLQVGRKGPYAYPKNQPDSGDLTIQALSSNWEDQHDGSKKRTRRTGSGD